MNSHEYSKALKGYSMALTVKETAEILRVSTKLVYRFIHDGTIPAVLIGRENRIPKPELIAYMRGVSTGVRTPNVS